MSRIDVKTLCLAFEKRIEALEKNPPDKVPTSVIVNLLEIAIEEEIRNHFVEIIKKDLRTCIDFEFEKMHERFVKQVVTDVLCDKEFSEKLENKIKNRMLLNL
jgi:phosphopantetheine adenylyltransferase